MEYGIIGNCAYNALIDASGRVAWLCWPRFDSSFVFGALLDEERGGEYSVLPARAGRAPKFSASQEYLRNTNVLRTVLENDEGSYEIIDFAPRFEQYSRTFRPTQFFRIVRPLRGRPMIRVRCRPRYNYGAQTPAVAFGSNHLRYEGFPSPLRLTTNATLTYVAEERAFELTEPLYFCLSWGLGLEAPLEETADVFLKKTKDYWRRWVKHCSLPEMYQSQIIRSALVLKLHQYEDTGAIIAASTTSIPEGPGTERNWDYRFCWLRDTFFVLSALRSLGQFEELEQFVDYLGNLAARSVDGGLQPVYAIDLEERLEEIIVPDLAGYRGHKPVRVGNAAFTHKQHDVYGEMLVAIAPLFLDARFELEEPRAITLVEHLLGQVRRTLFAKDAGLWEFRGLGQLHTFTLLMHWVGAEHALRIAEAYRNKALAHRAQALMSRVRTAIERDCWNRRLGCYTQARGNDALDAALFCMVNFGYLPPDSARTKSHVHALRKGLSDPCGLLYRYRHRDDFGFPVTTFSACGFWCAEALARIGATNEATLVFERLIGAQNRLGLLSEDIEPLTGELWGNFPQTYSHVGLINTAFALDQALRASRGETRRAVFSRDQGKRK